MSATVQCAAAATIADAAATVRRRRCTISSVPRYRPVRYGLDRTRPKRKSAPTNKQPTHIRHLMRLMIIDVCIYMAQDSRRIYLWLLYVLYRFCVKVYYYSIWVIYVNVVNWFMNMVVWNLFFFVGNWNAISVDFLPRQRRQMILSARPMSNFVAAVWKYIYLI